MINRLFAISYRALCLIAFAYITTIHAEPIISFFFRDYPENNEASALALSEKFKKPDSLSKHHLEGVMPHHRVAGIMETYFGFLQVSSLNGQVVFPRKQSKNSLTILVTEKITPITLAHNTISHWQLEKGTPVAAYDFTFKEDPDTKLTYWDVREGTVPADNKIDPLTTLIILANPSAIYVSLGATITPHDANLILPDLYVKKSIDPTAEALYMLNLAHYFRPVDLLYKKQPQSYETLVLE